MRKNLLISLIVSVGLSLFMGCQSPVNQATTASSIGARTLGGLNPDGTLQIYQAYANGDHFYTANYYEYYSLERVWQREGVACSIWPDNGSGTRIPLYRLYSPSLGRHFYTASQSELDTVVANGWIFESTIGYVYSTQLAGKIPLYRAYCPSSSDHYYTTLLDKYYNAISLGFRGEGVACYVNPAYTY